MSQVYLITGASTGFGALSARALANEGHTVFAGMHSHDGNTSAYEEEAVIFARENNAHIRTVPLNLLSQESVPPHMRHARRGHVVWIGSSSTYGANSPFLGAYFAAKAAQDSLAQSYAAELAAWGIETTIVSPGVFTKDTNHFLDAAKPGRPDVVREYKDGPTNGLDEQTMAGTAALVPPDADPQVVADALVELARLPRGQKPFRMFPDPTMGGGQAAAAVVDNNRVNIYRRMGILEYLKVRL
ncbi:hypothetical protein F4825DRAFT_105901 [Nemania diffusa]|nr:hypothetical protein F4825DRAFT_105901 [Nemania diffusa]